MQFFNKPNIDFMGSRKFFAYFSITITIVGVLLAGILGIKLGIDFKGGAEIAVEFEKAIDTKEIRKAVDATGMTGSEVKSYGGDNKYLIRVTDIENGAQKVSDSFTKNIADNKFTMLKEDKIGPKIGGELFADALWAVLLAVAFILVYIAFRFEFTFGLGAIVALVHDVVVTFSLVAIINHLNIIDLELNQTILAAMLTVIGYSINDTVIIFDRIRENKERHKGMNLIKLINMSINETLSRTVNTVGTTVTVLFVLLVFGGPVLQGFAFTMLLGLLFGTYSSIYIASAFVIWYTEKVKKVDLTVEQAKKTGIAGARI